MKNIIRILLISTIAVSLGACGFYREVKTDYEKIVYFNGINEFEAITIAEYYTIKSEYRGYYDAFPAVLRKDDEALRYPDYWFVDFSPKLAFDAASFLVVIRKSDGEVLLAMEYWPRKRPGLDWVFKRLKM